MTDYYSKYLKYKNKYLSLKNDHQIGGANCLRYGYQQHSGECWNDSLSMLMMQSDGLKDIFISQLYVVNVDEVHRNLTDLFATENINKNAYLLPFSIYMYYLKYKTTNFTRIIYIIREFLRLSKEYVKNHIERAKNRINNDDEMTRYTYDKQNRHDPHLFDFFTNVTELQEELKAATTPTEQTRIRRRMSVHVTNVCTNTIKDIYFLILEDDPVMIKTKKQGGSIGHIILAMEILNMYIIRSKPDYNYLYLDIIVVDTESDKYKQDDYKDLLKLLNDTLLGVLLMINFGKNEYHVTSLYKCDKEELLYDDNSTGPQKISWYTNIHEYLASKSISYSTGHKDYLAPLHDTLNSMYKHKDTLQITNLLFTRKRMFSGDTDIDREVKFILNKLNKFLQDSEISLLLQRLFEITGTTIDNFDTQLGKYTKGISPGSLFNKAIFSVQGIKDILNKGLTLNSEITRRIDDMF